MKMRKTNLRWWSGGLAAIALLTVPVSSRADLADRYVIDVYKPDKAFSGTTIFGDATDLKSQVIVEVDMTGRVIWSYDIPTNLTQSGGRDVEWIPHSDHILFTSKSGVYEVDRQREIVWSYEGPTSHDADRLPNGNTLMAWAWGDDSSDPEVREVDAKGNVVWKWHAAQHLTGEKRLFDKEGYTHTNSVTRLANDHTLISLRNFFMLVEVDRSGEVVWKLPGLVLIHDPEILANGNILMSTRGPPIVRELTPAGQMVWSYSAKVEEVNQPRYVHRLPNGNTLLVENTKIIEITRQKEIVWQLRLKNVDRAPADKRRWLFKAERIPTDRAPAALISFAAPSVTLKNSSTKMVSPEDSLRMDAKRVATAVMKRMDKDKDGKLTKAEFVGRGSFDARDTDGDGFITFEEAEIFVLKFLERRARGQFGGQTEPNSSDRRQGDQNGKSRR